MDSCGIVQMLTHHRWLHMALSLVRFHVDLMWYRLQVEWFDFRHLRALSIYNAVFLSVYSTTGACSVLWLFTCVKTIAGENAVSCARNTLTPYPVSHCRTATVSASLT